MKVLFVVPRYHTNMTGWVQAFKDNGDSVYVHTMRKGPTENYLDVTPEVLKESVFSIFIIKIFGDGGPNAPRAFPSFFSYFIKLRKLKPDVLIVRDISRWFSFMAAVFARMLGIKVVIYSQMNRYDTYSSKRQRMINLTNSFFNSFWMTPVLGDIRKQKNLPKKVVFIPFVVTVAKEKVLASDTVTKLLSIGKFIDRKNHLLLLQVLLDLKKSGYKFHLTIIGEKSTDLHEGKYQILKQFITDNQMEEVAHLISNIPHQEMQFFYKKSDLFVLPASNEPASISVLEALGYGLPVVCSDTCGTRWYINNGENGYIFKDRDFQDLKRCLISYFSNDNKQLLSKNCIDNANSNISGDKFISLFKSNLQSLIN